MAKVAAKQMTRAELDQKIVALAWKDEKFRKAFLADPKSQFEERLGLKLAPGLKMTAHAEDDSHLYFVIPAKPGANELSDADLEKVAGGVTPILSAAAVVSAMSLIKGIQTAAEEGKKQGW